MSVGSKRAAIFLHAPVTRDARVQKTLHSLSSEGWSCDLFCMSGIPEDAKLLPEGVGYFPIRKKSGLWTKVLSRTWFTREHLLLYRHALKLDKSYQMVWANDLPCLYPAYCLARDKEAFFVYDSHEIYLETVNQFFPEGSGLLKGFLHNLNVILMRFLGGRDERCFGQKADLVVTVNASLKKFFKDKYGWDRIEVLKNAPRLSKIKPIDLKKRFDWPAESKILIYQGQLNAGRGLSLLLEAIALLPTHFHLLILGDGFLRKYLEEKASRLGLNNRVLFAGTVPNRELLNYTAGADIGINLLETFNLSKHLASPNKLFEYAHARIPVLCSDAPENRAFIEQYQTGILVENVPADIAEGIQELAGNFSVADGAFDKCIEENNWEALVGMVLQGLSDSLSDTKVSKSKIL